MYSDSINVLHRNIRQLIPVKFLFVSTRNQEYWLSTDADMNVTKLNISLAINKEHSGAPNGTFR